MDYKKRNEEILEKLRALRDSWASTNNRAAKEIEEAIPELIEAERIRKEIIDFATKANNGVTSILANNYNFNKWIAWVEKKAEQKTVVIIPKFRVGDVIRPKGSTAEYTIESISGECYHGKGWGLHISNDDDYELVEQKPTEWSEQDERKCNNIIALVEGKAIMRKDIKGLVNWLKFLKDRVGCEANCTTTWRPSDEQMRVLDLAIRCGINRGTTEVTTLVSLFNNLKKLMED